MKRLSLALAALLAVGGAQAATVSYSASQSATATNWVASLALQQFNSSLGTLTGVSFSYDGSISSDFRLESLDSAPATVAANVAGSIAFSGPFSNTLNITASATRNFSAFDGTVDFGGTSGAIINGVTGSQTGSNVVAGSFAAFIGSGLFNVGVAATGLSNASGAGNLISQINTRALANITVTYTYDTPTPNPTPEPASLALAGLALAGAAVASRRRRQG